MTSGTSPLESGAGPSFYAQPRLLRSTRLREWWTLLHPPYTVLHLALVTIGACLVGPVNVTRYAETLIAFFLALGIGAHALDELQGRPLRTTIPRWELALAAALGLGGAVGLGVLGMFVVSYYMAVFIAVGAFAALSYNLELFGGRFHNGLVLVLAWGAFPILTAYYAQHGTIGVASVAAAAFGALVVELQRTLSTPARELRRRTAVVAGTLTRSDGTMSPLTMATILGPLERSLKVLCWLGVALAVALAYLRLS
ncbi:MAG TPA: hypothetical protein VMF33_08230 [Acidimicrobiales bacterium]|nr:hypothetical protein [Acidimicrobiales bacterium]